MRTEAPSAKFPSCGRGRPLRYARMVRNADTRMQKNRLSITNVRICDETGEMQISVFNGKYPPPALRRGELCAFYGKISRDSYGFHMTNPVFFRNMPADGMRIFYDTARLSADQGTDAEPSAWHHSGSAENGLRRNMKRSRSRCCKSIA